jgi:hypothetical protein
VLQLHGVLAGVTALERTGTDVGLSFRTGARAALRFDSPARPRTCVQADVLGLPAGADAVAAHVARNDPRGLVRAAADAGP